jgi:hypothetical protein
MKFSEFQYKRPDIKELENTFKGLLESFDNAESFESQSSTMEKINALRNEFESMSQIVSIRHTIDSTDKFYEDEQNFFDENTPIYQGLISSFYSSLVNSKFKDELEKKWGKHLFNMAELTIKTFSPEIIEDLQFENKLPANIQSSLHLLK